MAVSTASQSEDGFLGGRIRVRQPRDGFRSGLDAVMVAAAVPAREGSRVLELGTGCGVAALCLATRVTGCLVEGVDLDGTLVGLANQNAASNGVSLSVRFHAGDIFALPRSLRRQFDHVFTNPPFHGPDGLGSPLAARVVARQDDGRLGEWLRVGLRRTVPGGSFTTILRADRLGEALAVLPERGVSVLPLWPRVDSDAGRVIIQAIKGARTPLRLLSGLLLHRSDGRYTEEAEAVLAKACPLLMARERLL
jgi:tRNA1(Val) A37 N6-methylase TrmN6